MGTKQNKPKAKRALPKTKLGPPGKDRMKNGAKIQSTKGKALS